MRIKIHPQIVSVDKNISEPRTSSSLAIRIEPKEVFPNITMNRIEKKRIIHSSGSKVFTENPVY